MIAIGGPRLGSILVGSNRCCQVGHELCAGSEDMIFKRPFLQSQNQCWHIEGHAEFHPCETNEVLVSVKTERTLENKLKITY